MIPLDLLSLANHLWQSTLFLAGIWLVTLTLRNNRAAVRHMLWLAASIKFLIPFSLLVSIGTLFQWRTAAPFPPTPIPMTIAEIAQPFEVPNVSAAPIDIVRPGLASQIPAALFLLWSCGFVGSVLWWVKRWSQIQLSLRRATPLLMDIPIRVMSCREPMEPGVFGIVRPVLLLPDGITDRLSPQHLQAVVAHELCHVRRRDNLSAAIHMFVEALFWFYPLLWWLKVQLIGEQERACDEEVLRLGGDPQVYAESILKICQFYLTSPLLCVAGITGSDLKKRIGEIMRNRVTRKLSLSRVLLLAVGAISTLGGPVMIGAVYAKAGRAQPGLRVAESQTTAPTPLQTRQSHAEARQAFELASIKPLIPVTSPRGRGAGPCPGVPPRIENRRLVAPNVSAATLIVWAYGMGNCMVVAKSGLLSGGPDWLMSDRFEIQALTPEGSPANTLRQLESGNAAELQMMMQTLLADRFKLSLHREIRELPVYALTMARGGPKLQQFEEGSCDWPEQTLPGVPSKKPYCGGSINVRGPNFRLTANGLKFEEFSKFLSLALDRPVIDRTGIAGVFDFLLNFAIDSTTYTSGMLPADMVAALGATPSDAPSIFTAVQEQLGLKLEAGKGPVEVLVIDHLERPMPN